MFLLLSVVHMRHIECALTHTVMVPTQAYDQHLNMILGDVEETITSIEIDDETYEEIVKARIWIQHKSKHFDSCATSVTSVPMHAD